MIISRTPYRMSFFGGGTDYPAWYCENGGAVLATTIDKYCYITCRYLPPFFEHKSRIVYSQTELVNEVDEIRHVSVKETLKFLEINKGVEIHHDGDLPSRSGLGSSSSFTVGLLNALYAMKGIIPTKKRLAEEAIHIEQDKIKENIGSQDQISAAFGGLNHIEFSSEGFKVNPVLISEERLACLQDNLMLFFTGLSRTASQVAKEQIKVIPDKKSELSQMYRMVEEGTKILKSDSDMDDFGRLLDESWKLKRSLTSKISSLYIDYLYNSAKAAGATGGKILGAGGGGFILFYVKPEYRTKVKETMRELLQVPFRFENSGSCVIYNSGGEH